MPPKRAGPARRASVGEQQILLVQIMAPIDSSIALCSHDSYTTICAQCKAEQDAVDMFLI